MKKEATLSEVIRQVATKLRDAYETGVFPSNEFLEKAAKIGLVAAKRRECLKQLLATKVPYRLLFRDYVQSLATCSGMTVVEAMLGLGFSEHAKGNELDVPSSCSWNAAKLLGLTPDVVADMWRAKVLNIANNEDFVSYPHSLVRDRMETALDPDLSQKLDVLESTIEQLETAAAVSWLKAASHDGEFVAGIAAKAANWNREGQPLIENVDSDRNQDSQQETIKDVLDPNRETN